MAMARALYLAMMRSRNAAGLNTPYLAALR